MSICIWGGSAPLTIGSSMATLGYRHAIGLYVALSYAIVLIATGLLRETRGQDFLTAHHND